MTRRRVLVLASVLPWLLAPGGAGVCRDDFGRWQAELPDCQVRSANGQSWSCQRLEVIQTSDQVISLRFVRQGDDRLEHRELQVIGIVKAGEGLDCNANGCSPTPSLHLMVTGLATLDSSGRGLAPTSPVGAVARGECQWLQRQLRCSLRAGQAPTWTIQASL